MLSPRWPWILSAVVHFGFTAPLPAQQDGGGDWAQFRGPGGKGTTAQALPINWGPNKSIAWKIKLPGAGYSSPVVFGNRIYLTTYSGFLEPGKRGDMKDLKR